MDGLNPFFVGSVKYFPRHFDKVEWVSQFVLVHIPQIDWHVIDTVNGGRIRQYTIAKFIL